MLRKGIERPRRRELTRRRELAHGLRWDTLSGNKAMRYLACLLFLF